MVRCIPSLFLLSLLLASLGGRACAEDARDLVSSGMQKFRANDAAGSLADFDRAAQLEPKFAPQLWQRGISDYYAGKFREGRQQFELHQTVNPHDVENAAWHFLCVARVEGLPAAKKSLLKIDTTRDSRVPMAEIYAFYSGRGSKDSVLQAAAKEATPESAMYADLYLGLYYEAAGDKEQARAFLRKAAAAAAPPSYMQDVAKVHLRQRRWDR